MSRDVPVLDIFTDGASHGNPGPAGIGIVLRTSDGATARLYKYIGHATNNVAEYTALMYALQAALMRGARRIHVRMDSELVARQMAGTYRVREESLRRLHEQCRYLVSGFEAWRIDAIPREENTDADRLAGLAVAARPDMTLKHV